MHMHAGRAEQNRQSRADKADKAEQIEQIEQRREGSEERERILGMVEGSEDAVGRDASAVQFDVERPPREGGAGDEGEGGGAFFKGEVSGDRRNLLMYALVGLLSVVALALGIVGGSMNHMISTPGVEYQGFWNVCTVSTDGGDADCSRPSAAWNNTCQAFHILYVLTQACAVVALTLMLTVQASRTLALAGASLSLVAGAWGAIATGTLVAKTTADNDDYEYGFALFATAWAISAFACVPVYVHAFTSSSRD